MKRTIIAILMFVVFSPFVLAGAILAVPIWYFMRGMEIVEDLMKDFDKWLSPSSSYVDNIDWDDE